MPGRGRSVLISPTLQLAATSIGPVQFDQPVRLWLFPVLVVLTIWIGRKSLAGLGSATRWIALAARVLVLALLTGALAEPHLRDESTDVSVTFIHDSSRSVPSHIQKQVDRYIEDAAEDQRRPGDRLGLITVAKDSRVIILPSAVANQIERSSVGNINATNLEDGVDLALATRPNDAATRIVIASDGNETEGSLLRATQKARAANVPIDVLPFRYSIDSEVIVERVQVPATARKGQTITVKPIIRATKTTSGTLTILLDGQPLDLSPDQPGAGIHIELQQGLNTPAIQLPAIRAGPHEFQAVFEPDNPADDAIVENNRALGITFVSGEGKVLLISDDPNLSRPLIEALNTTRVAVEERNGAQIPETLTELNGYDAIVLVNQPIYNFSEDQQQQLAQYVHDSGGGLVVIGGPDSFGAGGWIGSDLEDALPIQLDPPQKRQMPRGALVLVIHSVEISASVFFGQKICQAAVDALSRRDLVGIVEYDWRGGTDWVYPISEIGDGIGVRQAINNLQFGDMPSFVPSLQLTLKDLSRADAAQKHVIIISDGDPSPPSRTLLQGFIDNNITISTVAIASHGTIDLGKMRWMANFTKGRYYNIPRGQEATIPRIFIKEAQTIRRALIWEGNPFQPATTPLPAESMAGIDAVPPISGYVIAAQREGLALATLIGKEDDPICAQWQYGLGKVVTFTSDASSKWAPQWLAWDQFNQFWEQHIRWAMRPSGSANVDVITRSEGDWTRVEVRAYTLAGDPLEFADFRARVANPDGDAQPLNLRQIGAGLWEGRFRSDLPGSYIMSMLYAAPAQDGSSPIEGSVQAAVTRPFSDEFRSLEDNTALLRQVAEITGGRVLPTDPLEANLWDPAGLTFPVSTRSIWLAVATVAIGVFLFDVAVRRVRIDVFAISAATLKAFQTGTEKAGAKTGQLRAARDRARKRIDQQANAPVHKRKFEADKGAPTRSVEDIAHHAQPLKPSAHKPKPKPKPADQQEEGISRLLKAKRRAQDKNEEI